MKRILCVIAVVLFINLPLFADCNSDNLGSMIKDTENMSKQAKKDGSLWTSVGPLISSAKKAAESNDADAGCKSIMEAQKHLELGKEQIDSQKDTSVIFPF